MCGQILCKWHKCGSLCTVKNCRLFTIWELNRSLLLVSVVSASDMLSNLDTSLLKCVPILRVSLNGRNQPYIHKPRMQLLPSLLSFIVLVLPMFPYTEPSTRLWTDYILLHYLLPRFNFSYLPQSHISSFMIHPSIISFIYATGAFLRAFFC